MWQLRRTSTGCALQFGLSTSYVVDRTGLYDLSCIQEPQFAPGDCDTGSITDIILGERRVPAIQSWGS
jgi:hypothetical protein